MRYALIVLWVLLLSATSAIAQVSIGIGLPGVSIGINLPVYPELVPVPGYPVYYAPRLNSNFFFYDGMYWVYQGDNWYASSWYNGPWGLVGPQYVPLYILRVPVRYYRSPPPYFRGWQSDAPPRWGQHWGREWEQQRHGWDRWDRKSAPAPAPLPVYQRQYSGDRYPRVEQQQELRSKNYRYQPHDPVVRQHYQEQERQRAPARSQPGQQGGQAAPRSQPQQREREDVQRSAPTQAPPQQKGPAVQDQRQQQQREREDVKRSAPTQAPPQQKGPAVQDQRQQQGAGQRGQQAPRAQGQEKGPQGKGPKDDPERQRGPSQEKSQEKGQGRE
jgi:hypothetical protein